MTTTIAATVCLLVTFAQEGTIAFAPTPAFTTTGAPKAWATTSQSPRTASFLRMSKGGGAAFAGSNSTTTSFATTSDKEEQRTTTTTSFPITTTICPSAEEVRDAKENLVRELRAGVDDNAPELAPFLQVLKDSYAFSAVDARTSVNPTYNGKWTNINTPDFPGRLGFTNDDDATKEKLPIYTIGRMTFGLLPSARKVEVAVERMTQTVELVERDEDMPAEEDIPESLRGMVRRDTLRRNYIDTVFVVPDTETVKGILRMEGYTLPNPNEPNRYDTWFVGGRCIARDDVDVDRDEWKSVFGNDAMEYSLAKPATAYQTVVYLDEDVRVSIGNHGSVMIVGK